MKQELRFLSAWRKRGHVMAADDIDVPERPIRVWTLLKHSDTETPSLPYKPAHRVNAFLEDEVHDWNWHNGKLRYRSRIVGGPVWILIEFEAPEEITFNIGGAAMTIAALNDPALESNPIKRCTRVRKYGRSGFQYRGARTDVLAVLRSIENCAAYSPPGVQQYGEGFAGEYAEVAAVRRASDAIRKALGLPLLGNRRRRVKRR